MSTRNAFTGTKINPTSVPNGTIVLWQTAEEMEAGWPVMQHMYPHMRLDDYQSLLHQALLHRYVQFAYLNAEQKCLGVIGLWFVPRFWCGLQADIDNFAVDETVRSQGIGKRLLDHCLEYAKAQGANIAVLNSYVDNPASHRFYFREGFTIRGYHFVKSLNGQSVWE